MKCFCHLTQSVTLMIMLIFPVFAAALEIPLPDQKTLLIERFQPGSGEISTFRSTGTLNLDKVNLQFTLHYRNPDQLHLEVRDQRDGTPVLVAAAQQVMFYDPLPGEVLYGHFLAGLRLEVKKNQDANVEFNFQFAQTVEAERLAEKLASLNLIDLPAVLELVTSPWQITIRGEEYHLLGETRSGGRVELLAGLNNQLPELKQVALSREGINDGKPFLVIHELKFNPALPDARFSFPTEELKQAGLPLRELPSGMAMTSILSQLQYARALMGRFLLTDLANPENRSLLDKIYPAGIDWEQAGTRDVELGAKLREVFPAVQDDSR